MRRQLRALVDRYFIRRPRLRRAVTRWIEGDRDQQVDVCGTSLTINSIKEHGYLRASRLCRSSSLLRDELAVIVNLAFVLEARDTFVDIGANVGFYTHTIARLTKLRPELRVYAFEANPDTFLRLTHAAGPQVHAERIALSDEAGMLEFVEGAVSHVFTTAEHRTSYNIAGAVVKIPARRLDECEIEGDSLVIKVDVEGQEGQVLRGATGLFEDRRVKAVYLDGYADRAVESLLKEFGFHLFEGRSLEPTSGDVFSLLAIHPDKLPGMTGSRSRPAHEAANAGVMTRP